MSIPRTFKRWLGVLGLAAATAILVTACGGGGDGGGSSNSGNNGNNGSGGSDGNSGNTAVINVNAGVANVINIPTISVKVCAPGTSNCQVVSNVLVDTASYGLRLVGSAVSGVLGSLPQVTSGGAPVAECGKFVSSYTWGSVRTVDLSIGAEQARSLPVQIIGDLGTTNVPASCTNGGASANSASALGANGILGIGPAPVDCGTTCATSTSSSNNYYACPNGDNANCAVALVPVAQQVANPVHHFADSSGVSVTMPGISNSGQASSTGTLTFGLPDLTGKTVMTSTTTGDVSATFLGRNVTAFFDTGSNAYFFNDSGQTVCSKNTQFYCPSSPPASYSATLSGQNGVAATVSMSIANADSLFSNPSTYAFNDIAGPFGSSSWLDIGMPHFYGRTIYFGMDKTSTGGAAPFVAF
ncbi:hypothetical protein WL74_00985 [Burkholderia cepacia]|uniref:DUF3443 family protein n=1 Tax=Burkholderia TaxID=32008 RepID=UPI000758D43C|nr:DUF3443 family protein [Burkholderia cepacia]KVU55465.1 hypothetical protein WK70_22170 [Burkholderia cepacia]KWE28862.1 hypothetical protein WL74_00985 [Burkholderia cepacia]MBJ9753467.1 DUF3443 family protein [Burkholderia cepacia]MCA7905239.1 DUF3443 domain-containing protein [Burkholderia cepacia]MCA7934741.1 DUF3443 domain-containing protein [Burkholderia cepacia]